MDVTWIKDHFNIFCLFLYRSITSLSTINRRLRDSVTNIKYDNKEISYHLYDFAPFTLHSNLTVAPSVAVWSINFFEMVIPLAFFFAAVTYEVYFSEPRKKWNNLWKEVNQGASIVTVKTVHALKQAVSDKAHNVKHCKITWNQIGNNGDN